MAMTGSYTMWGTTTSSPLAVCLQRLARLSGAENIAFAGRRIRTLQTSEEISVEEAELNEEILGRGWSIARVSDLVIPNSSVSVHFGACALAREIESEVNALIDKRTRETLTLFDPIVTVGPHTILDGCGDDAVEHVNGLWSLKIFGNGYTRWWREYRVAFGRLPRIAGLQHQLKSMFEHVHIAAFMSG